MYSLTELSNVGLEFYLTLSFTVMVVGMIVAVVPFSVAELVKISFRITRS